MLDSDQVRHQRRIRLPRRRLTRFLLVAGVAIAALAPAAWATHQFADVPTSSPHHDDISTIARASVTGGCGPGLYCPTQTVQRDQMASFIARALRATWPITRVGNGSGAIDPDANAIICQTANFTFPVSLRGFVYAHVALRQGTAGELGYKINLTFSGDGGANWTDSSDPFNSFATTYNNGAWSNATLMSAYNPGTGGTLRVGIRVTRDSGVADASDSRCRLQTQLLYTDAGAPPWGP